MIKTLIKIFLSTISKSSITANLAMENLALRQQTATLKRISKRPQFQPKDRLFWVLLSRLWCRGELLKLGIGIPERTVSNLMPPGAPKSPSQTWRAFLKNHMHNTCSMDFFTIPTATFKILFALVILSHDRRKVVHFNVTTNPTAKWTAQQVVEAFPWDTAPKYLLRDRDSIYGGFCAM
jgi:hypothetical protein